MKQNSLFWTCSTEEGQKPSTIYGTIHLGTPECLRYIDEVKASINAYDRVYTESPLSIEDMQYAQAFAMLPEDVAISDYISARRWSKMRATFLKYTKVDIDKMRMFRPLFILAAIQSSLVNGAAEKPIDHQIWEYAQGQGKGVYGLESSQEQVDIMLKLDIAQQYLQLVQISKKISKTRAHISRLLQVYVDQDIIKMYKMSKSSLGIDRKALVQDRNHILANRVLSHHREQPSFFSFGAGHLAGGLGVLKLLKSKGAKISPVLHPSSRIQLADRSSSHRKSQ